MITGADLMERHLRAMTSGFGSSEVIYQGQTTRGNFEREESLIDGPQGVIRNFAQVLTVPVSVFEATPTRDSTITIDGTDYMVRNADRQGDGRHYRIEVAGG
jgi:hypothetical protein